MRLIRIHHTSEQLNTYFLLIMKISMQVIFLLSTLYVLEPTWERISMRNYLYQIELWACLQVIVLVVQVGGRTLNVGATVSWAGPWLLKKVR